MGSLGRRFQTGERTACIASLRCKAKWRLVSATVEQRLRIIASAMQLQRAQLTGACAVRLKQASSPKLTSRARWFRFGSVSEVYAWAADCCGEAGPRRCPPDHADEMEPSQIAVQVLRGDAAIAAQETLQLAVAAIDRLNVEGIPDPLSGRKVQGFVANAHGRSAGADSCHDRQKPERCRYPEPVRAPLAGSRR